MKIPPGWDIPLEIRARLGERSGRQRELAADEHVVMVLHKVPETGSRHRDGVYFWRTPEGEWRYSGGGQPRAMLQRMIDEYEDAVDKLAELHERSNTAFQKFAVLEQIGPLNRAARNFADTLLKARNEVKAHEGKKEFQIFCDHANEIARACELLQLDARNSLDFHIAEQSEIQASHSREMERATHRLNNMAAIFLPLTAVASIFGMNLRSGLEESPPWLFWGILGSSVIAGLVVSEFLLSVKWRKRQKSLT